MTIAENRKAFHDYSIEERFEVNDPQAAKCHVIRIVVLIEGECVIRIKPAKVKVAALASLANRYH